MREETEAKPEPARQLPPFERAIFDALKLEADQVLKVELTLGPRSQNVKMKFALTPDQVEQLNAMVAE